MQEKAAPFYFLIRTSASHREKNFMFSEGKENTERDILKPCKTSVNYFTEPQWLQAGLYLCDDAILLAPGMGQDLH